MIFQMWSWRVSDVSIQTPISWSHWTAQQPRTAEILCKVPRGHPTVCSRSGVCRLGEAKSMTIGIPWWMGCEKWWTRVRDVAVDVEVDCLKWVSASFLTLVACLPYFEDANISVHTFMMAIVKEQICSTSHSGTCFSIGWGAFDHRDAKEYAAGCACEPDDETRRSQSNTGKQKGMYDMFLVDY